MRFFALVLLPFLYAHAQEDVIDCNYIELVKCFMNVLDDWAIALWDTKENVVTIDDAACVHLHSIGDCVEDQGVKTHYCSKTQVMESAQTVSDLLTHHRGHGNFLWSYYLLKFSCSARGREILTEHRDCLSEDRIGQETLSATTFLINTLNTTSPDKACAVMGEKLDNFRLSLSDVCGGESPAAEILCESLKGHSTGVFPDKVGPCNYNCKGNMNDEDDIEAVVNLKGNNALGDNPVTSQGTATPQSGAQAGSAPGLAPKFSSMALFNSFVMIFSIILLGM